MSNIDHFVNFLNRPSNHLNVTCIHDLFICLAQNFGLMTVCNPLSLSIKSFTNLILFKQSDKYFNLKKWTFFYIFR